MPKATEFKAMSKSQREAYLAGLPKPPAKAKPEKVVRISTEPKPQDPTEKDGLLWLAKKKRLTQPQLAAGFYYRDLYRNAEAGDGSLKSCLDVSAGGGVYNGGRGGGLPFGGEYSNGEARLQLFVIRSLIFGEQDDLVTVMDGVCGLRHTVRYLAGGDQLRSSQLEAALRIALDLLVKVRRDKEAAKRAA